MFVVSLTICTIFVRKQARKSINARVSGKQELARAAAVREFERGSSMPLETGFLRRRRHLRQILLNLRGRFIENKPALRSEQRAGFAEEFSGFSDGTGGNDVKAVLPLLFMYEFFGTGGNDLNIIKPEFSGGELDEAGLFADGINRGDFQHRERGGEYQRGKTGAATDVGYIHRPIRQFRKVYPRREGIGDMFDPVFLFRTYPGEVGFSIVRGE